jgi:hypothetical protein
MISKRRTERGWIIERNTEKVVDKQSIKKDEVDKNGSNASRR